MGAALLIDEYGVQYFYKKDRATYGHPKPAHHPRHGWRLVLI